MNAINAMIAFLAGTIALCILIPIFKAIKEARRRAAGRAAIQRRNEEKSRETARRRAAQEAERIRAAQVKHAAQAAKKSA